MAPPLFPHHQHQQSPHRIIKHHHLLRGPEKGSVVVADAVSRDVLASSLSRGGWKILGDRSIPFVQLQKCKRWNTINTRALCAETTTVLGNRDIGAAVEVVLCVGEGDETHEGSGKENDEV